MPCDVLPRVYPPIVYALQDVATSKAKIGLLGQAPLTRLLENPSLSLDGIPQGFELIPSYSSPHTHTLTHTHTLLSTHELLVVGDYKPHLGHPLPRTHPLTPHCPAAARTVHGP